MSRSPSPDHLSLSAGSWKSETSPLKVVKSVVQRPVQSEEPVATSSPKHRQTRRDSSPHTSRKRVASSEARRDSSCHSGGGKAAKRVCPICNRGVSHVLRRHVLQVHLPVIADPSKVCWVCRQSFVQTSQVANHLQGPCAGGHYLRNVREWAPLVMTMFKLISHDLNLDYASQLIAYVAQFPEICPNSEFTPAPEDVTQMTAYNDYHKIKSPRAFTFAPPNSAICLLHWRILANLLMRVSQSTKAEIFALISCRSSPGVHKTPSASSAANTHPPSRPAPAATVSVAPFASQAVPMAPPTQPQSESINRPVVPTAPRIQPLMDLITHPVMPMASQSPVPEPCSVMPTASQSLLKWANPAISIGFPVKTANYVSCGAHGPTGSCKCASGASGPIANIFSGPITTSPRRARCSLSSGPAHCEDECQQPSELVSLPVPITSGRYIRN